MIRISSVKSFYEANLKVLLGNSKPFRQLNELSFLWLISFFFILIKKQPSGISYFHLYLGGLKLSHDAFKKNSYIYFLESK